MDHTSFAVVIPPGWCPPERPGVNLARRACTRGSSTVSARAPPRARRLPRASTPIRVHASTSS